jgi:hypothetical protein
MTPGSYNVAYTAALMGGSGTSDCSIASATAVTAGSVWYGPAALRPSFAGVGFLKVASGDAVHFRCTSGAPFTPSSGSTPTQVFVTPVDTVAADTLTAGRQTVRE